jgi:hypothetical protein
MYLERVPNAWLTEPERENGIRLEKFDAATDFAAWERGRIFCEAFELRWEKVDGAFHLVYAGAPVELDHFRPAEVTLTPEEDEGERDGAYHLWGKRVAADKLDLVGAEEEDGYAPFVEGKVSRVLYYPVSPADHKQRIKLTVREYVDPEDGRVIYYRFRGIEEVAR